MKNKLSLVFRVLISILFLVSAIAKLWTPGSDFLTPLYALSRGFEEGQLIPMGFSENLVPYLSRFIIALEFFIALAILQNNYLKKIVIPLSVILLTVFSLHLSYSIFTGDSENCGCFGDLIPMTPLEALIKNILTIGALIFVYRHVKKSMQSKLSILSIQFLSLMLLVFTFLPVQSSSSNNKIISSFSEYVDKDININDGSKILCFFEPGCSKCEEVAVSLKKLSETIDDFPEVHIIFSQNESEKIPNFFKNVGKSFSYQTVEFYNEDEEVNSFIEILGFDYSPPAVIFLKDGNQLRFFDYTEGNKYSEKEMKRIFEIK